jgi:hypothetical protein
LGRPCGLAADGPDLRDPLPNAVNVGIDGGNEAFRAEYRERGGILEVDEGLADFPLKAGSIPSRKVNIYSGIGGESCRTRTLSAEIFPSLSRRS